MKIGINALYLIPGKVGGSEIYLRRLLSALSAIDRDNEYVVFCNRENYGTFELGNNFRMHRCPIRASIRPVRIVWEQLVLPYRVKRYRLHLLHSPGFIAPLFLFCPSVITILDLIYLNFPEAFPAGARLGMRFLVSQSARRSAAVIALSNYCRDEMLWALDLSPFRVKVIYLGCSSPADKDIPREERSAVFRKFGITPPYLLAVAAAHPHKNLFRLLEAFYSLAKKGRPGQLVIMGVKHNRYYQRLKRMLSLLQIEKSVVFTGWVRERDKEVIYSGAEMLVFPSLLEGFGLPVLEAMSAGIPVACSNDPSLREVAGEATYLFNPYSVEDIAAAVEACLDSPPLRDDLIRKGKEQAARFSWEETARQTLELYRNVVSWSR